MIPILINYLFWKYKVLSASICGCHLLYTCYDFVDSGVARSTEQALVFKIFFLDSLIKCSISKLIGEWWFDGSTDQSEYKQCFSDSSSSDDDSSLFVTAYVTLQLVAHSFSENIIVWNDPRLYIHTLSIYETKFCSI